MNPKQTTSGNPEPKRSSLLRRICLLLCWPILLWSSASHALPSDKEQNINVAGNEATIDSKQGQTILRGQVKITQGTLEIYADKVTLFYDDKRKLKSLLAEGTPARFQQQLEANKPLVHAEAENITYLADKEHLTLEKNALVEQKGATTRGGRIDYDITTDTAHAVGTNGKDPGRVEFVIPPQTDKKD